MPNQVVYDAFAPPKGALMLCILTGSPCWPTFERFSKKIPNSPAAVVAPFVPTILFLAVLPLALVVSSTAKAV